MIKTQEDKLYLGGGIDSFVYLLKDENRIMKIYEPMLRHVKSSIGLKGALGIVEKYYSDTSKAMKIMQSEGKYISPRINAVKLGDEYYRLMLKIVPQGSVKIRDCSVIAVGQEYLPGDSLLEVLHSADTNPIYSELSKKVSSVHTVIRFSTNIINEQLNASFKIVEINIKPVINKHTKTIDLMVTDLACDIKKECALVY